MKRNYIYSFITIISFALLLSACASKAVSEETGAPQPAADPARTSENIAKSEELFRQREDLEKLREAIKLLIAVRDRDNRNYEIEWKFAKYNYFLGKHSPDAKESEEAFADGAEAGKIASRLEPNKPEGHFWYGANLGEQARQSPITVGLKSIDDIRAAMERVIEIEPGFESASAYDALGQLELATRLTKGKAEKAVEYLEKGLQLEKDNSYIYLHLAEAYLATNRDAEAKKHLEFILQMKPKPDFAIEHRETVEKAKKLLETRF